MSPHSFDKVPCEQCSKPFLTFHYTGWLMGILLMASETIPVQLVVVFHPQYHITAHRRFPLYPPFSKIKTNLMELNHVPSTTYTPKV